jgi:hypothetical protein
MVGQHVRTKALSKVGPLRFEVTEKKQIIAFSYFTSKLGMIPSKCQIPPPPPHEVACLSGYHDGGRESYC